MYNPADWYWVVAGSTTQVWCSARMAYVPVTDTTYASWLASGYTPSTVASEDDLVVLMQEQWEPLANAAGVIVTSTSTPTINGTYAIDASARTFIYDLAYDVANGGSLPGGGTTFDYPDINGIQHAFSATNFSNFAAAIESFIAARLAAYTASIKGTPTPLPPNTLTIA
jgi:hypothetical protein